jgi:hypothetical protein
MEEWREYMNTGYWISNMGNVMNKNGYILNPTISTSGYKAFGKSPKYYVHKVVAHCFIGERPERLTIDHINRNRIDNRVENLRYVSQSENNKNTCRYRINNTEQDSILRKRINIIDYRIRDGILKKPREYYIERLYNRINHQA